MKELQEARTLRNTIATIKTQIEYILWLLANTTSNTSSTSGGGTTDSLHYVEATKAALPDPASLNGSAIGRVEGVDANNGKSYIINPGKTAWVSFTHLE